MKETLPFVVGTGAALLGIALVANGIQEVQFGPRWEVPVAAEGKLFGFGIISVLLYLVGIFSYVRGDRFASQTPMNRGGFWFLLCVGAVLTTLSFALDPGQWPITHQNLSAIARRSSIPISTACGLLWVLLIARSRQRSLPQVP
jgi:succinate-acetate transporter protein